MTTETKLRGVLTMALLGLTIMTFFYFQQRDELVTLRNGPKIEVYMGGDIRRGMVIDSLKNRCDSLYDELFNSHVENGRYELTFDHLKEVNPVLGKQMEEWMNHETE